MKSSPRRGELAARRGPPPDVVLAAFGPAHASETGAVWVDDADTQTAERDDGAARRPARTTDGVIVLRHRRDGRRPRSGARRDDPEPIRGLEDDLVAGRRPVGALSE